MAVTQITDIQKFIGLSTDTKPSEVSAGSEFYAKDTGEKFIYDGSLWFEDLSLIYALSQVVK